MRNRVDSGLFFPIADWLAGLSAPCRLSNHAHCLNSDDRGPGDTSISFFTMRGTASFSRLVVRREKTLIHVLSEFVDQKNMLLCS